jgi:Uma2 family endonuclease
MSDIILEPPYLIIKPGFEEEEFYRLADEDSNWEYLDGRIIVHSPASYRHERIFAFLFTLLQNFVDVKKGGVVLGSRYPMRLDARWSPEPDIVVVLDGRRHLLKPQRLDGPADLVIEIASESDPGLDYREKLPRYREAEIPEIWIVDPFKQQVVVEKRSESGYTSAVESEGIVQCSVLPGFWIRAGWLWREDPPSPAECLRELQRCS